MAVPCIVVKVTIFAMIFRNPANKGRKAWSITNLVQSMKGNFGKTTGTWVLLLAAQSLWAQAEGATGSSNLLFYILLAIAVLVVFALIVMVSDNLLAIEARNVGADPNEVGLSLLPNLSGIVGKRLPEYVNGYPFTDLNRGHDILLEGEADAGEIEEVDVNRFAIMPPDFIGISPIPKMTVEEGDSMKAGDILFFDKKRPEIKYAAPVSGEVISVERGAKRSIAKVVILADKEQSYRTYSLPELDGERETLIDFLLDSGAWPLLRQRPFNVVPDPAEPPRDIFISTFDSAPLAPDANLVVSGREAAFQKGLDVLNRLTDGDVYLGLDARTDRAPSKAFTGAEGVRKHWFRGKHPAGNVGVQIHHIKPINPGEKVWTLGVQEVITLGTLFSKGKYQPERVVALTGSELRKPRYVRTYQGASAKELLEGNLAQQHVRIISGDVLSGRKIKSEDYLHFYDDQITVIQEGDYYEMFGWLLPLKLRPTVSRTFPNFLFPDLKFEGDTNMHGEKRAFVVTGQYEKVLPMDIYPQHLMKAILINDFEQMEGLGIYELSEEDVALCEFVCTSKQPLQQILRNGLDTMREQS